MKAILTVNYLIFQRELLQQQKLKPYHFSGVIANGRKKLTLHFRKIPLANYNRLGLCELNINPVLMTPPFINHFQSNLLMKSFFSVNQSYNVNLQGRKRAVQKMDTRLRTFHRKIITQMKYERLWCHISIGPYPIEYQPDIGFQFLQFMINLSETAPSHTHLLFRLTLEWFFSRIFLKSALKRSKL